MLLFYLLYATYCARYNAQDQELWSEHYAIADNFSLEYIYKWYQSTVYYYALLND